MNTPVEARTLAEAREAASVGADIVMLDNYSPERLREDAAALKAEFPSLIIEGSGVGAVACVRWRAGQAMALGVVSCVHRGAGLNWALPSVL